VPTVVAVWLQISGSSAAAFVAILAMLICTPIAALFFWHARKLSRAAADEAKQ
jgi:hypothetical protein